MGEVVLKANDISSGYGKNIVLRNISFNVDKGGITGIIGPNGSGKTTLIRTLTKIIPLKTGAVILTGRDIYNMTYQELAKKIAVVSQINNNWIFDATVEEMVLLGRIPHFHRFQLIEGKRDKEIVEEAMRFTDILELKGRDITEISGGERQRVFIARALAQKPLLLLLDEPTAHLDINHRLEIFRLIKRLADDNGFTVISVLHDLNLASRFCKHIILLHQGQIAVQGKPEEVISKVNIKEIYGAEINIYRGELSDKPQILY